MIHSIDQILAQSDERTKIVLAMGRSPHVQICRTTGTC